MSRRSTSDTWVGTTVTQRISGNILRRPPGARYVEVIGGIDATVAKAEQFADQGDLRFAAELASHAVFAEPNHAAAKDCHG